MALYESLLYEYFSISISFAESASEVTVAEVTEESFESNDSEQRNSEDEDVELFNMPNLSLLGILLPEEQHDSEEESCCSVDSEDDLMELFNIPKNHLLDSSSPEGNG